MKTCGKCKINKDEMDFAPSEYKRSGGQCRCCRKVYRKEYNANPENKIKMAISKRLWAELHTEELSTKRIIKRENRTEEQILAEKKYQLNYYNNNKEHITIINKLYAKDHKDERVEYKKKYYAKPENKIKRNTNEKYRRENDPKYKFRTYISTAINDGLKAANGSKNGRSIIKYLPYTFLQLTNYIEKLFLHPNNLTTDGNVWMTWNNRGKYNKKTWNDNDPKTWKWQLDHIIPQSDFTYISMEEVDFQKCWALSNLRPYSAKLNQLDGATRVRHNKNKL